MKSRLVEKIVETEKYHTDLTDILAHAKGGFYSFLNPVSYLKALKHQELFCLMDGLFADGVLLVAAIRLFYGVKVRRRSFDMTSLARELLENVVAHERSVYIVGARQEQLKQAVIVIREYYKDINIVGFREGYFDSESEEELEAQHIASLQPDLLIVGMGSIKQERFLLRVKEVGFKGLSFSCGGFIHQASQNMLDYYPAWVNQMNIRFLYRMYKEPHTRQRYLMAGFIFPVRFVWERFFG